ncbi:membrane-spanning 4-domains subfamily A member 6D-like [Arvicanthis niloticus]|uniref:membrane-spanning 4-domains subfamily A member 6D-like n=1 Tax=Arvicanthis niloticus TaxID=61156 RepID=UPI0014872D12|nr:membrane-spanning 4-domains subfamily A member 6D-like [Arvicanthis niloticus]XP_034373823.1 membrane-spanning 4-domains subfamily A member 6D-like [Arvicanthis niloticus]
MIPQVVTNETVTVISPNGISFPQTDKPQPTQQKKDSLKKHLKAEIKVMAAIQIMCAVMVLALGIILASVPSDTNFTSVFSALLKSGYPFIGALCFVISGILSLITEKKMTKPLVHSSLALSILSVLSALTGIIILSVSLATLEPALQQCKLAQQLATTPHYYHFFRPLPSNKNCFIAKAALTGVFSLMLISSVLELGLGILIAILRWKQSRSAFSGNVVFLSQDSKNKSSMSSESLCNPAYEKLLTS